MALSLSDFDYHLPEELVAQTPLEDRAASRLLHIGKSGAISHGTFRDAVDLLREGDLLVMNNTRVTALRLFGRRPSGGRVEALLLAEGGEPGQYSALVKPAKKLSPGQVVLFEEGLDAEVIADQGDGRRLLAFRHSTEQPQAVLARLGQTPLPPYIHAALADASRYQTVYASQPGSAAAPTAGLHFTVEVLDALKAKGVETAEVTLDVSVDTFRPVQTDDPSQHVMHGERCRISPEAAKKINSARGRVVAVGTTSVRTLESFAVGPGQVEPGEKVSSLYIQPGSEFRVVKGMFTNFHMPKTTMLLMISAMAGRETIMEAYRQAVELRYRFLSFGDSMLILPD